MSALPIENPHARQRRRGRAKPAPSAGGRAPSGPAQRGRVLAASPAGGTPGLTALDVTFAELGVPGPLVAALADAGITAPFPIQAATLPDALAGTDILGWGRTGSGKTLGFSIPLAARLAGVIPARAARAAWSWCPPGSWPARSTRCSCRWPGPWT